MESYKYKDVPIHTIRANGDVEVQALSYLTLALGGDKQSSLCNGLFISEEIVLDRKLCGPQIRLDVLEKRNNFAPTSNQTPYYPCRSLVAIVTASSRLYIHKGKNVKFILERALKVPTGSSYIALLFL